MTIIERSTIERITLDDGTVLWYSDGKCHNVNGPAIIYKNGTRIWVNKGRIHNSNGPAIIDMNGKTGWYLEGKRLLYSK